MNRLTITLSLAAAFAAGCSVTHLLRPAIAAENVTAQVIHTGDLEGDGLGAPNAGGMRSKLFVAADGNTYGFGRAGVDLAAGEAADALVAFFLLRKRWPRSFAAVSNFARPNRLLATA